MKIPDDPYLRKGRLYGCTCLDEVGKIPWVMYRFRKYKWVRDLTRENPEA
jgi:hypothetical protein